MRDTIILIRHTHKERDDRASRLLASRGWRLRYAYPTEGETLPDPADERFAAAVVFGGMPSANDDGPQSSIPGELRWIERWLATGRPYLGLCLGGQMLAKVLGARVAPHDEGLHEIGFTRIAPALASDGFLRRAHYMYQWHKEGFELAAGCSLLACGEMFPNQAFRYGKAAYGLQFHPEVTTSMMRSWLTEAVDKLRVPGAHSLERQMRDAARFNEGVEAWFAAFLDAWVGHAHAVMRAAPG